MDGGVRIKLHRLHQCGLLGLCDIPAHLEANARKWFMAHHGDPYDVMGNINAMFGFVPHDVNAWFCSEAICESLGLNESWRYKPNGLAAVSKEL